MLLIGLTGGIACGKSFVSDGFAALGIHIIDADLLAREVVEPGSEGLKTLVDHFSETILDSSGALNRGALRDIVFADPEALAVLDNTLHPRIRALSDERIAQALDAAHKHNQAYIIYAVPLLVETSQQGRFDRIIVVDIPKPLQLQRLTARDNSNMAQAQTIIDAQASRDERLAIADDIIDNSGTKKATLDQIKSLHQRYLHLEPTATA